MSATSRTTRRRSLNSAATGRGNKDVWERNFGLGSKDITGPLMFTVLDFGVNTESLEVGNLAEAKVTLNLQYSTVQKSML